VIEIEVEKKKNFGQNCNNPSCRKSIIQDNEFKEFSVKENESNEIVLKNFRIMKLNKITKEVYVKCLSCKTWNKLFFTFEMVKKS